MPEPVVGWDLGGAHLKAARLDSCGAVERVVQLPCPLWLGIDRLHAGLEQAAALLGPARLHAVTMTGEMVDLFPTRNDGVERLVTAMRERYPEEELRFYAGTDGFVGAGEAAGAANRIASANWMASGTLVAGARTDVMLVDIGSTTTDLVVVRGGRIAARGFDDATRLAAGELVYTGVVRTPVMAMAERVPFEGVRIPLIAENFATAADVHRLTGRLREGADQYPAADGGEKTAAGSARRLARMIGHDSGSRPLTAWSELAAWLAGVQLGRIFDACAGLIEREGLAMDAPVVGAGIGRFLAEELAARLRRPYVEFGRLLPGIRCDDEAVSDCAPAVAVARLAQVGSR